MSTKLSTTGDNADSLMALVNILGRQIDIRMYAIKICTYILHKIYTRIMHIIELSFFPFTFHFYMESIRKKRLMRFFMLRETTNIEKFYNLPYLIITPLILSVEKIILCHYVYFISCSLQRDISLSHLYQNILLSSMYLFSHSQIYYCGVPFKK